ncbi:hypothetical protein GBF38_000049, partial [Nibea albiflora]
KYLPFCTLQTWKLLDQNLLERAAGESFLNRGARLACPKTERCARRARNRDAPLNLEVARGNFGSEPPGARSRRIIFDRGARLACPKTERCARACEEPDAPLNLEVGTWKLLDQNLPGARSRRIIFDRGARLACPKTERCARRARNRDAPLNLEVGTWKLLDQNLLERAAGESFLTRGGPARVFLKRSACAGRARNRDAPLNLEVGVGGGTRLKPPFALKQPPFCTPQGILAPLGGSARTEQGCLHFYGRKQLYLGEKKRVGTRTIKRAITPKIRAPEGGKPLVHKNIFPFCTLQTWKLLDQPPGARSRRIFLTGVPGSRHLKSERCARLRGTGAPR